MQELLKSLKSKFSEIKHKMEGIQTKQMQNIFQLVELDNNVKEYFSKEKKEALEQILSSNVIKDILKMTSAKNKSPVKNAILVSGTASAEQRQFDKSRW